MAWTDYRAERQAWNYLKRITCAGPKYTGPTLSPKWANDFDAFLADVGPKPPGKSIALINPSKNFEPGNVEWRDPVKRYSHDGETLTLREWSERSKDSEVPVYLIRQRIRNGWSVADAISLPTHKRRKK